MKLNIRRAVLSASLSAIMMSTVISGTAVYAETGPSKGTESFDINITRKPGIRSLVFLCSCFVFDVTLYEFVVRHQHFFASADNEDIRSVLGIFIHPA